MCALGQKKKKKNIYISMLFPPLNIVCGGFLQILRFGDWQLCVLHTHSKYATVPSTLG